MLIEVPLCLPALQAVHRIRHQCETRAVAGNTELSPCRAARYCTQLQYTRRADECQVFCKVSATAASGKTAINSSFLCASAVSRNSFSSLAPSVSKYSCGIDG